MRRQSDPVSEEDENGATYWPSGFSESSGVSVYENLDRDSSLSASLSTNDPQPQTSTNNGRSSLSSGDSNPFSPLDSGASSGDSNPDEGNAQYESIVCSSCSRNLPRTEYSVATDTAMCNECLDEFS